MEPPKACIEARFGADGLDQLRPQLLDAYFTRRDAFGDLVDHLRIEAPLEEYIVDKLEELGQGCERGKHVAMSIWESFQEP